MFHISVHHLAYGLPDGTPLFADLNFTLSQSKTGLVGDNGVGKSTLLHLLLGEKPPLSGSIVREGRLAMVQQHRTSLPGQTVAEFLGISKRLLALRRILAGTGSAEDLRLLDDDWELETRIAGTMAQAGLTEIALERSVSSLSGGELSRLALAAAWLSAPDFILLDEPTNHLDQAARAHIYGMVRQTQAGLLVVSHDRELLRLMDQVLELSPSGLRRYGGNYDAYAAQKAHEQKVAAEALEAARTRLQRQERRALQALERQERRTTAGAKRNKARGVEPAVRRFLQDNAANTARKGKALHEKRVADRQREMMDLRSKLDPNRKIKIDLAAQQVPSGKAMLTLEAVNFGYPGQELLWPADLNLSLYGQERVWLKGRNGAGKSTLLRLLQGALAPTRGRVRLGSQAVALLDQKLAFLDGQASLLDNLGRFAAPDMAEHQLRTRLARFLFRDDKVFQRAATLSGGERMRLGLACLLITDPAPDLLILDEPTNNLDLRSIAEMVQVLESFPGAMLLVSHDADFVREIGVEKEWELLRGNAD